MHIHKCPVCEERNECHLEFCMPTLEDKDGKLMLYKTCEECVKPRDEKNEGLIHLTSFNYRNSLSNLIK